MFVINYCRFLIEIFDPVDDFYEVCFEFLFKINAMNPMFIINQF